MLPSLLTERGDEDAYRTAFEWVMAACGLAVLLFAALCLRSLRAPPARTALALGAIALFPLLAGSVILTRFDLWPAALVLGALAAFLRGRDRLGAGVLGLAVAAKIFPAVLAPLALALVWRRRGREEALRCLAILAGVVVLAYLPFAILGLDGVLYSLGRQLGRPLQIESLGSALFLALHQLTGLGLEMRSGHGSQNLAGTGPAIVSALLTLVQLGVLIWIWLRRPRDGEELIRWSAAALVAFVALGKVLSPQFLLWLIPVVPLVGGRRGVRATGTLAVALVLTQLWFPSRYWDLVRDFAAVPSWLVVARDLVLLALLAVLVRGGREPARSP